MNLSFLESLIMGFVSGLTEVLPVSAEAHRTLLRTLFGAGEEDALFRLFLHISCFLTLYLCLRGEFSRLRRASELMKIPPKRRRKPLNTADANTLRLLRSAAVVLVGCKLLTNTLSFIGEKLYLLPTALLVNGLLLMIPVMSRSGNMDSRNMPRLYGWLMGFGGGLSVIPGISLVGASLSLGQWRGVDRQYGLKFALMLLMVGLGFQCVFDVGALISGGIAAFSGSGMLTVLAGALAGGFGCWLGVKCMTGLAQRVGFSGFAFYSWGMALFCFVLFLMI